MNQPLIRICQSIAHSDNLNYSVIKNEYSMIKNEYPVVKNEFSASTSLNGHNNMIKNSTSIDIKVRNIVCTFSLPLHIDLKKVAMNSGNVTLPPNRGFLEKRKRDPKCLVRIFSSGKITIVGCRSESECKKASRQIARLVQRSMDKLHIKLCMRNYKICNIMATCKMPFGVKIEEIARKYPKASYEPEVHSGLNWHFDEPKATLVIHTTGNVTITGAVSEAGILSAIEKIYPILKEYSCMQRIMGGYSNLAASRRAQKRVQNSNIISQQFYVAKRTRTNYNTFSAYDNGGTSSSGMYGNKMYFSDEDEMEDGEEVWQDAYLPYDDEMYEEIR